MSINQQLLPFDMSNLQYGDKVWFIIKTLISPVAYKVYVQENTWRGSKTEIELLNSGQCFSSEKAAIIELESIIRKTSNILINKENRK